VNRPAGEVAPVIAEAFEDYRARFAALTRKAGRRFEQRDWPGAVADATERLDLYSSIIDRGEETVRSMLGRGVMDRTLWSEAKSEYSGLVAGRQDRELAETFFNSVTRRVFATVGVDGAIEFVDSDFDFPGIPASRSLVRTYGPQLDSTTLIESVLRGAGFSQPFEDLRRDVRLAGARLAADLRSLGQGDRIDGAEVLRAPFFRRKGAYLLGRLLTPAGKIPLAIALLHPPGGIAVDALLTDHEDVSILFSFTRSHFHVDLAPPSELVRFLKTLMPRKPLAELYIALGHHKHGKTELYRDLLRHLEESDDRFVMAPGTPGMVMMVFMLQGHDVVLKVIRDHFPAIKPITPSRVRENYRLVFRHDRAGRLVEAQEFEHLQFDRARFSTEVLEECRRDADRTVMVGPEMVVVHHAYIERRVVPLDVHLRRAEPSLAQAAVADFGQAIKDLAASGIFPGELLPKNFGVTRHSRVVCYDYDELGLLTDFSFRELPAAPLDEDEYADEAWFGAGPRDVFPQEFRRFLALPQSLRETLERAHGDLYGVPFWRRMQAQVSGGEILDIFPYNGSRRLRPD
jgi:isocitrate dehydrogenase kinase/phosphatase